MEVMEIAGKDPLRAPISLALDNRGVCELDRVGLQRLGRARLTTGRKRVQRSQRVQEEPEVLVADTMDVPEGNGNPLGNGLGRARQTRPIGQGDAPNRHQQRQGIVPPPVQNHNFEIKLGMINLVRTRCSMDCQLTKLTNGRRACPMAQSPLGMNARRPFLLSFSPPVAQPSLEERYPASSSETMRHSQRLGRGSKGYTSQCPHHGFNNESLLSTLYRGCLPRYREMLDTASNGNFLNQDVDDGWQLVENIANSNGSYGEEYDRTNRSSTHHSIESDEKLRKDVKALNEKLDKLILAQSTMKKVNFVSAEEMEPVQEGEDTQFAEVCYMSNGQGGYNKGYYNYKSNPAMSYRNTDVANPQDQVYPQQQAARSSQGFPHQPPQPAPSQENELKAMLKQLLQGQADGVVDTSKKLAEINSRSRTSTQGFTLWRIMLLLLLLLQSKDNYLVKLFRTPRNSARSSSLKKDLLKKRIKKGSIESTLARSSPTSSVPNILLDPYQPVATSSSRLLSQGHKEVIHKFRRDLSGIGIELPPMDSMSEAFDQMQMVKDVLANSDKVSEVLQESTHQFNLLTSPTFLPKVKDQGKFTLPCTLGHLELDNALVDSGASINLISLSMAEKLGIAGALQRPTTSIMFGDATSKSPLGVFKNYHLKIGECIIQTDLTVMEMEEEKDLPLLLGTPFLSTVGASIDFHKQEVILHKVVKERVDKEPRVGKDKVERGPRIEKPRLERARVEKPRSDRPRADRLVQAPCVLDEESLQALFDEPLGRALKEGEDVASKARPGIKEKIHQLRPLHQAISAHNDFVPHQV
ncbi:unnamed protein product [Microthlaspi erraticum]|uniref:Uncharacterized protein n=1 Tax=Microthlaspi erraticum TaxID=1685480 RepID=A0A6D2L2W8_9BRAS|nr:unnamed protein product [Microthlaspi erraticum]